jgi:DNA-binding MarR family transcriptional regulator
MGLRKYRGQFSVRIANPDREWLWAKSRKSSIKDEREYANVGELAERLQAQPHGVAALVTRCEARGFVYRRHSDRDGREVEVRLLKAGERLLVRLAALHRAELKSIRGVFPVPLGDG